VLLPRRPDRKSRRLRSGVPSALVHNCAANGAGRQPPAALGRLRRLADDVGGLVPHRVRRRGRAGRAAGLARGANATQLVLGPTLPAVPCRHRAFFNTPQPQPPVLSLFLPFLRAGLRPIRVPWSPPSTRTWGPSVPRGGTARCRCTGCSRRLVAGLACPRAWLSTPFPFLGFSPAVRSFHRRGAVSSWQSCWLALVGGSGPRSGRRSPACCC